MSEPAVKVPRTWVCLRCEHRGKPHTTGGAAVVGILLILLAGAVSLPFMLPTLGLAVVLFPRVRSECTTCGSNDVIPNDSPRAQRLLAQ